MCAFGEESKEETYKVVCLSMGGAEGEWLGGGPGGPDEGWSLDIKEEKREKRKRKRESRGGEGGVMEALLDG